MSHAVYAFLCRGEDPVGQFESSDFNELLDENNWYQAMAAINRKGEVKALCPENDYRERFWLQKKLENEPAERRWEEALRFAEEIAVWEIGTAILYLTPQEERKEGGAEHKSIAEAVAALRKRLAEKAGESSGWAMRHAACMIEQAEERVGPFTTVCANAYNSIRAVSLMSDEVCLEDDEAVILFVDIHT